MPQVGQSCVGDSGVLEHQVFQMFQTLDCCKLVVRDVYSREIQRFELAEITQASEGRAEPPSGLWFGCRRTERRRCGRRSRCR